jgi:hypothetical protein
MFESDAAHRERHVAVRSVELKAAVVPDLRHYLSAGDGDSRFGKPLLSLGVGDSPADLSDLRVDPARPRQQKDK